MDNQNLTAKGTGISLSSTVGYVCTNCGSNIFDSKFLIRKVSRFITGQTKDAIVPVDIIVCSSCGTIAKDLLPEEVEKTLFPDVSNS